MKIIKNIAIAFLVFILYLCTSILLDETFSICFNSSNTIIKYSSSILCNVVILLIVSLFFIPSLVEGFKKINKKDVKNAYKNWALGLIIMYVSNLVLIFINHDIASNEAYNRQILFDNPLYAIIVMVIVAPILEELIFRLSIKNIFKNKWKYALTSGFIFGLMHMTTVKTALELLYIIPYGALGFMFAKSVYESDNIWCSIITHMTHNGAIITILFIAHFLGVL